MEIIKQPPTSYISSNTWCKGCEHYSCFTCGSPKAESFKEHLGKSQEDRLPSWLIRGTIYCVKEGK